MLTATPNKKQAGWTLVRCLYFRALKRAGPGPSSMPDLDWVCQEEGLLVCFGLC